MRVVVALFIVAGFGPPGAAADHGANPGPRKPEHLDLLAQLWDKDFKVRRRAAVAFGRRGPEAEVAVAPLTRALRDDFEEVAEAAGVALARIGPAAVPALVATLEGKESRPRRIALDALCKLGPAAKPALPAAVALLKMPDRERREREGRLRSQAVDLLHAIGPDAGAALPALLDAAREASRNFDDNHDLPVSACRPILAAVRQIDPKAGDELAKALVPPLTEQVRKQRDSFGRAAAVAVLGESAPREKAVFVFLKRTLAEELAGKGPNDGPGLFNGRFVLGELVRALAGSGAEGRDEVRRGIASEAVEPELRLEALQNLL